MGESFILMTYNLLKGSNINDLCLVNKDFIPFKTYLEDSDQIVKKGQLRGKLLFITRCLGGVEKRPLLKSVLD
jgi:hypothetical protein